MSGNPDYAIAVAWLAWLFSWWLAAFWRKRAVKRPPGVLEMLHLLPTIAGGVMIFLTHAAPDDPSLQVMNNPDPLFEPIRVWRTPIDAGWVCVALVIAGFLFCWWARIHLGQLWSGSITLKADHRVVDTGPYRLVRHPIYTGLLLAAFATAAEKGTLLALVGAALMAFGFWLKAGFEERFLRQELGREAYDGYARRTRMLVPFLF
jgi:protein-S-isoprenylcysteine O-methyltransferase Ste14